jgi:hypothetical protein
MSAIPTSIRVSPMRVVMNAFFAALPAAHRSASNPMRR